MPTINSLRFSNDQYYEATFCAFNIILSINVNLVLHSQFIFSIYQNVIKMI